jgi:intraflagellar transport protein 172
VSLLLLFSWQVTVHQIKGDIEDIERGHGRTEVIVDEGISAASYLLDEAPIEFGTAIDDGNYVRAMELLEGLEVTPEAEAMWQQLGEMALAQGDLRIAERCAAALGDVSRARYLHRVNKVATKVAADMGGDGTDHWAVRSKMALLKRDLRLAEDILMAQVRRAGISGVYSA